MKLLNLVNNTLTNHYHLNEMFNSNIYPYKLHKTEEPYPNVILNYYEFVTRDNVTYRVVVTIYKEYFEGKVDFNAQVGDKYHDRGLLNNHDSLKVLSTIMNIVNQHKKSIKVLHLTSGPKRTEFYKKVISHLGIPVEKDHSNHLSVAMNESRVDDIPGVVRNYVLKFDSDEKFLRSGGLPNDILDKWAFGFNDSLNTIDPKLLNIRWKSDYQNVLWELQNSGLSPREFSEKINLDQPIDVSFTDLGKGPKFYIEDGHHRYYAAKTLNKPLKMNLEIKVNPIQSLSDKDYDEFHRNLWKSLHKKF